MDRRYINSTTAASLLDIHESTIRRQVESGRLNAERVAGGTAHAIRLKDILKRATPEKRLLWYESQSGLAATVTDADLATCKADFGEAGITALADRQQAVMALDGILNSGERGARTAAIDELAKKHGVTSRTLRRWHAA